MVHSFLPRVGICITCFLAGTMAVQTAIAADKEVQHATERIVNLGDSITDGQTYALLVEQALNEAGKPVPKFFGAGIGGDTASGMRKRLDRDVLSHRPTMVMLSCGINDVGSGVKPSQYEADVTAIAERMKAEHVRLVLLTTTNLERAPEEPRLDEINRILHQIAAKYGLTVAEVYDQMQAARKKGTHLWESDGCHLNFAGYRTMTRAVLDALGDSDVPVPQELHLELLPGLVREWKVLAITGQRPALDEKSVLALSPNADWRDYTLPETKKVTPWWLDQERQRGVSVSLPARFGPAKSFVAVSDVQSPEAKAVYLNTGGELSTVWLNGNRVLGPGDPHRGWHPGAYRKPVQLLRDKNRIVVETGAHFFVSLTEGNDW